MSDLPERWYCVSSYGIATLCKDEEDARATARHCDLAWPKGSPHRAVVLGDVAAAVAQERERCAKLCENAARTWLKVMSPEVVFCLKATADAIRATATEPKP